MRTTEQPAPTQADFAVVTLVCTWPGPVGLSPAGCDRWEVRLERRAVEAFKRRADEEWTRHGIRVGVEEEVDPLS